MGLSEKVDDLRSGEILKPVYNTCRPVWVSLFAKRDWKGKQNWWAENGFEESDIHKNKFRIMRPRFREEDPDWFDPKVADGASLSGPFGLDSRKHPDLTIKGDQIGLLKDFQEKVYKSSAQYKAIAEKYDLTPEHPGLNVNPTLTSMKLTPKHLLGVQSYTRWHHYGPRFFETPLNEGTLIKGLACAKYAAIFMIPMTFLEIRSFGSVDPSKFNLDRYFKRYLQLSRIPALIAFTWGASLSMAAAVRNKDDTRNHLFSSAAVGATLGTLKGNSTIGITTAILTLFGGVFWHYWRISTFGLQGVTKHQVFANYWSGPLTWKYFSRGDAKVPTNTF